MLNACYESVNLPLRALARVEGYDAEPVHGGVWYNASRRIISFFIAKIH